MRNVMGRVTCGSEFTGRTETHIFDFKNFELLSTDLGEQYSSPTIYDHRHKWTLDLYPGGISESSKPERHISCYLSRVCDSGKSPFAQVTFRCGDFERTVTVRDRSKRRYGFRHFVPREKVISDFLEKDGTFTIEVDIQMDKGWFPRQLQAQSTLIHLFQSSDLSDVEFTVESTNFTAHKIVLFVHCRELYDIASERESASSGPIPIIGHSRAVFKILLKYVYTVEEPLLEDLGIAQEVLVAADQYGVIGLKMLAESTLAYKLLSVSNWAALLVFSHSRSCPLLKEVCMQFYNLNSESCVGSKGWRMIRESSDLFYDLFFFSTVTCKMIADASKVETWDVAKLREGLEEAGLDLDGSREVLIKRLEEHKTDGGNPRKRAKTQHSATTKTTNT